MYDHFRETGDEQTGKELLKGLDRSRKEEWESKVSTLNFAKSSKKAWALLHRLNGKSTNPNHISLIPPDSVAAHSKGTEPLAQKNLVNREYLSNFRNAPINSAFSTPFSVNEVQEAMSFVVSGKASGTYNIFPDFLKHLGPKPTDWIARFFFPNSS